MKSSVPHAAALARGGQQGFGLLDRGGGVVLIAERLASWSLGVANSENG